MTTLHLLINNKLSHHYTSLTTLYSSSNPTFVVLDLTSLLAGTSCLPRQRFFSDSLSLVTPATNCTSWIWVSTTSSLTFHTYAVKSLKYCVMHKPFDLLPVSIFFFDVFINTFLKSCLNSQSTWWQLSDM